MGKKIDANGVVWKQNKKGLWVNSETNDVVDSAKKILALRKGRDDKGKRRVDEAVSKAKRDASQYARRYRHNAGFKDELTLLVTSEGKELVIQRTKETGIRWDLDHMLPMKAANVSGLHCADNLQVIPARLNRTKNNRLKYTERGEWLSELKA